MISIITFNLSGLPSPRYARARVRKFAELATETGASLISLQELHTYGLFNILKSGLKDYPHVVAVPGIIGPKAGLATFSKYPLVGQNFVKLGLHRGVLISHLDGGLHIFNVHLTANTDGDWSPDNRFHKIQKQQLDVILKLALYENGHPLVVTGDFNLAKTSELYANFLREGGWQDAFAENQAPTFHREFLPAGREPQCVDYIFAKGEGVGLYSAAQIFQNKVQIKGRAEYLSNHIGLIASFRCGK